MVRFSDHDVFGLAWTKIDARDQIWRYVYNGAGRLTDVTDPTGRTIRYEYDQKGHKLLEQGPGAREFT